MPMPLTEGKHVAAPVSAGSRTWAILHLLEGVAAGFAAAAFAWLLLVALRMIASPAPQEMREGAIVLSTLALLDGVNPYGGAGLARGAGNLYGVLYPLVVAPAAGLFGAGLVTHRAVAALGIAIATWLVWRGARQAGGSAALSAMAAALSAAGWLYWVGPTVRPDGVGLACMLGALVIAAPAPAEWRRFVPALLLSLAGFAAKIYFLGGIFIVVAHVLLFIRWQRGLVLGLAALAALAGWAGFLALMLPGWAALVLGANVGAASYDVGHLLRQGWDWLLFSVPLVTGLAAVALVAPAERLKGQAGFWCFAALCGLAVLLVSLGGHGGAHMTYFFHLLTPPLAVAIAALAGTNPWPGRVMLLALPPTILLNAHWFVTNPHRFATAEARFAVAGELLAAARAPLVTTEFAALAALAGHVPVETGHSEYMLDAAGQAALRATIRAQLAARQHDVVIVNRNNGGLVLARDVEAAGYRRVAELPVDLVWAMQSWEADIWLPPEGGGAVSPPLPGGSRR
ncbi:MAG: hypothetical protein MUC89_09380 [Acetobacteraceae bacterium]|nr:hypothetical protein [Acetobacteraceae bacterium]